MIQSFKHKGLELFFKTGKKSGIQAKHAKRIRLILGRLNASASVEDMNLPGLYLHQLSGKRSEYWSVRVSGNWRITFRFNGIHAELVDYEDYLLRPYHANAQSPPSRRSHQRTLH